MPNYYIGFDSGTQGTKVAVYAEDSTLIAEAYREHVIKYPKPGWAEMDPDQFHRAAIEGIKECMQKSKLNPADVKAISCSGIIVGIVPIDDAWNAVGPFLSYLDVRAKEQAQQIKDTLEPLWAKESGNADVDAFMPPVIIKWLQQNDKDLMKKTRKMVAIAHYVMGKLGGFTSKDAYIDWSDLSGWIIGYDAKKRAWSQKQMDILGIPSELLPKVVKPWDVVGQLSREQASLTGLREGIALVAGSGDIMQSTLGSSVVEYGQCSDVAGTASIFTVDVPQINPGITGTPGILYSMCTLDAHYMYWGYIRAGGLSLRWFRDELFQKNGDDSFYVQLDKLAEKVPEGCDASLFLPFLQGGDSSLPNASAAWVGLFGSSNSGTLWRSMMEAIAFEYLSWVLNFRKHGIDVREVVGTGGGSRSPLWDQIKANILDVNYVTLKRSEGAVMANALLAAHGVGAVKDLKAAVKDWAQVKARFQARKEKTDLYRKIFDKRQQIIKGPMKDVFGLLGEISAIAQTGH